MLMLLLGLFGAALFYGDGVITPAISVLSAVEGLEVATPAFKPLTSFPITLGILVGLFCIQRHGTASVGVLFGPIMVLWFVVLAVLGVVNIVAAPGGAACAQAQLRARFPGRQPARWASSPWAASVLAVTGAEALYADMGHFGRQADPAGLVRPGAAGAGAQLLRPGRAAAGRSGSASRTRSTCWRRTGRCYPLVVLATVGDGDRLAGGHLRRLLDHPAGHPARLPAAHGRAAHLGQRDRPDLPAGHQLALLLAASSPWCSASVVRPTWPRPTASP